jgi:hypothetical protein
VRAAYLAPGDVILVDGERCTVRDVEYTHKDAVRVRLRGRRPLHLKWDADVERVS